ncbi:alpha/beta fold hydrolase [Ktedonospora formicarum]|uniref:Alpha/beta hydrolase n=1 Tax=Ktedonospora formicarum TaxID=2778364 RepID=A0A8J3MRB5_9CHLR|nr:alpha/beta hydrolase [Ktedonospora formicarum]GHO44875.1 hypothetical protein KSX_30380 [Ktedonospora formicarum]
MSAHVADTWISDAVFHADVAYIESLWQRIPVGDTEMPLIDIGQGEPLVMVPILEHLEFVYARQVRALSQHRRVLMYRRRETRSAHSISLMGRVEELHLLLDALQLEQADLLAHGDAAMVLLEFAARYPQRCRSLTIIAQGADYQIAPHPFIWLLHELYTRLPVEYMLPASFLRRTVINYITAHAEDNHTQPALPRHLIEEQFAKIERWPFVYKYSVLPVIHYFDMRRRIDALKMPALIINRSDDALSPEHKTRWMAQQLTACDAYHVVPGRERFFMYSQAEIVTPLIETFLRSERPRPEPAGQT